MKKNLLFQLLLIANVFLVASCSDDDDSVDLQNITTLNMLNEDNGRTWLGNSDIYITDENNFSTSSCLLVELGGASGIGKVVPPRVGDGLVRKAAVLPGYLYQAFDEETIKEFPSGKVAVMVGAAYYQFYVESAIMKDVSNTGTSVNVGAVVKYASLYPDSQDLPEYGKTVAEISSSDNVVEMQFPDDVEFDYQTDDMFDVQIDGGKLTVTCNYTYYRKDYPIYVRRENVFTGVIIRIP